MHANTVDELIQQLVRLMTHRNHMVTPILARSRIANTFTLVVQLHRDLNGFRCIQQLTELLPHDAHGLTQNTLFRYFAESQYEPAQHRQIGAPQRLG
jgi:Flp pilus assembly CpaF family ATPase